MTKRSKVDTAVDKLFSLVVRTRFRSPGTSSDPYLDTLVLWVSVVSEVRELLAPLNVSASTVEHVEYVYRESVESWLRGDEPTSSITDDPQTARAFADDEIEHRLREAIDPSQVWIV